MKTHNKKYLLRMMAGLAGYGLGIWVWLHFYKQTPNRFWLVLFPVLPLIYIAGTIIHHISEMDEMWRKIMTEAWTFSAIATLFTCASCGFIRGADAPEFHAEWAAYLLAGYAVIGLFLARRRHIPYGCQPKDTADKIPGEQ